MKLIPLLTLVLPLALAGCASAAPAQPRQIVDITPARPETTVVERGDWSIRLPNSWVARDMPDGFLARDPDRGLAVAVKVQDLEPDDIGDADFGGAAVLAALQVEGVKVINAVPHEIAGRPGSAVLLLTDEGVTLLQYAVGAHRRGYLAVCGGPAGGKIVEACQPILDTFSVKK